MLVLGAQLAESRDAHVVIVCDQVVDVLLEVGAGDRHGVDLVLADELGEDEPELGGAHGAAHRQHHLAAGGEVRLPRLRGVDERCGVEMTEVVDDEVPHGTHGAWR